MLHRCVLKIDRGLAQVVPKSVCRHGRGCDKKEGLYTDGEKLTVLG